MVKYKKIIITLLISVLSATLLFTLLYRFDNKYTRRSPQPVNGILEIEKN